MDNNLHFSSATDEWGTPKDFFDEQNYKWRFTVDVCASDQNHKCPKYYDKAVNGLLQDWSQDICWMNPPYGRRMKYWIKKAYTESLKGATVVCLVPARTDTAWWHEFCMKGEITFIRGRLKFEGGSAPGNPAPFPSALVVFRPQAT